jgi:hypothetical protein
MEIIDGQLHANQIGPNWRDVGLDATLDATIVAMDAVGVHAAVLDEFTGLDDKHHMLPGDYHSNGAWRPERPFSELAAATHPDRFVWLTRVDHKDPDLKEIVAGVRLRPGCASIRVHAGFDGCVWRDPDFLEGGYNEMFAACETDIGTTRLAVGVAEQGSRCPCRGRSSAAGAGAPGRWSRRGKPGAAARQIMMPRCPARVKTSRVRSRPAGDRRSRP